MANILIVGAGFVGGKLASALVELGHQVSVIRYSNTPIDGVNVIQADVTEPLELGILPENIDIFVYCVSAHTFSQEAYHAHYVQGLTHCLQGVSASRVVHGFFVSSSGVYAQSNGEWVDENSPTSPDTFSGQEMLTAEQTLLSSSIKSSTIVRLSGIYGPGRNRLINQARSGGYADVEPPIWTNRIHRDDCVNVLVFLIDRALTGKALDELYLATDDEPAPLHEILEWMQQELDFINDDDKPVQMNRKSNKRLSNKRLRDLGYTFKYPSFKDGYLPQIKAINADEPN